MLMVMAVCVASCNTMGFVLGMWLVMDGWEGGFCGSGCECFGAGAEAGVDEGVRGCVGGGSETCEGGFAGWGSTLVGVASNRKG